PPSRTPVCPFLLFLPPRPPRSTLFPYTTLFRSRRHPDARARLVFGPRARDRHPTVPRPRDARAPGSARVSAEPERPATGGRQLRDRKSTRLNSSHVSISYAVFCLK